MLFTTPSRLYSMLLTYYGSFVAADYAAKLLFLNPIAECCRDSKLASELLETMRTGRDREFLDLVSRCKELLDSCNNSYQPTPPHYRG